MEKAKIDNGVKVASGLFWSFGERICAQLVSTIVTIVLARLLSPDHYGAISLVTVFISICNVFVSSGFGSSIVQKRTVDSKDYNTAFWLSLSISGILYILLFIGAPLISQFYTMPELKWVIRVMALRLPIASINTIQQAFVRREMKFKKFFLATLAGTVISGFVGIGLAYAGAGVWALVFQYLTNTCIDTIVMCFVCGWNPRFQYSAQSAKEIFSFGWKVLATDLVSTAESNIRSLIVGKVFGPSDLAYYDQGMKYPGLLVNNINSSINKVMLPAYSQSQDNLIQLKNMLRKSIQIGMFLLAPVLLGFFAVSKAFVILLLTDKWIASVPFIQIFCVVYLLRPLETSCHQAVLGIGRSDVALKIMVVINSVALVTVLIAVFYFENVYMIALGSLLSSIVSVLCFIGATGKLLKYTVREQFADVFESLFPAVLMSGFVYFIGSLSKLSALPTLFLQIVLGCITYVILTLLFRNRTLIYFLGLIKGRKRG